MLGKSVADKSDARPSCAVRASEPRNNFRACIRHKRRASSTYDISVAKFNAQLAYRREASGLESFESPLLQLKMATTLTASNAGSNAFKVP